MKDRIEVPTGKLMVNEVLEKLWTYLTVNFIMKLSLVTEKDAILVVCDILSKMAYFVVTTKEISAEELVMLFKNNM